jgi:hypothetical protein
LAKCLKKEKKIEDVIKTLLAFREFSFSCCSTELKGNWETTLQEFSECWKKIHKNYGVNIPNKVHIIMDHVGTYIKNTGKSLGKVSDQIVESTHSALNKWLAASRYWIKDVESDLHGIMLYKGILHFTSIHTMSSGPNSVLVTNKFTCT